MIVDVEDVERNGNLQGKGTEGYTDCILITPTLFELPILI